MGHLVGELCRRGPLSRAGVVAFVSRMIAAHGGSNPMRASHQWTGRTAQREYDVREGEQAQGGDESAHRGETNRGQAGSGSAKVPVHQIDQLIIHWLGLRGTRLDRGGRAVFQVVAHQFTSNPAQRFLH